MDRNLLTNSDLSAGNNLDEANDDDDEFWVDDDDDEDDESHPLNVCQACGAATRHAPQKFNFGRN